MSKPGMGGLQSSQDANAARRNRLRDLAMETIDLKNDPYFMRNHLGSYECKLCLTIHMSEGSYLSHTEGKNHQRNLKRRGKVFVLFFCDKKNWMSFFKKSSKNGEWMR